MIVGIDPGITGAIALLKNDLTFYKVFDMPTMVMGKGTKQQVNDAALAKIFLDNPGVDIAFIEEVNAMPGQGVTSMFNFGCSWGMARGVLAALMIPYTLIRPTAWKRNAGIIGRDKDAARTMAQHLYPEAPLSRKKDIGRADAILIGRFGKG